MPRCRFLLDHQALPPFFNCCLLARILPHLISFEHFHCSRTIFFTPSQLLSTLSLELASTFEASFLSSNLPLHKQENTRALRARVRTSSKQPVSTFQICYT
uniref:Uncharacterized protein n=1 Tax=Helianthus annuus TaxID=4232 RepID=A0A251V353_HELAN